MVGIALKVWNALRIELKLEEQKRLLLEARLDALQRQINPHFLFNTLNSIASLVRVKPELAREMTVKLANILRALLKDHDTYVPLREELSFTDDYLDIEVVRFGADKLRVKKEIDPRTLEVLVPSILLQPLIENSIKHGLEPRIHGGTVTLRSSINGDRVLIEVADDGVGMGNRPSSALRRDGAGIGMKNVQERLEVLYGAQAQLQRGQQSRTRHAGVDRDSGELAGCALDGRKKPSIGNGKAQALVDPSYLHRGARGWGVRISRETGTCCNCVLNLPRAHLFPAAIGCWRVMVAPASGGCRVLLGFLKDSRCEREPVEGTESRIEAAGERDSAPPGKRAGDAVFHAYLPGNPLAAELYT